VIEASVHLPIGSWGHLKPSPPVSEPIHEPITSVMTREKKKTRWGGARIDGGDNQPRVTHFPVSAIGKVR